MSTSDKHYIYKVYDSNVYTGVLDNVINEFQLSEEINSAGAQIEIELAISFQDADPELDTDRLIDENGNVVIDETGGNILTRVDYLVNLIPDLNNRIDVYEFSETDTTGTIRFSGLVSKWVANYKENSIKLIVVSYGIQLDNFLVQILPEAILAQNTDIDSSTVLYSPWKTVLTRTIGVAQTFTITGDNTITKVYVTLGNPGTIDTPCTVSIVEGTIASPGATIGTVTRNIPPQADISTYFQFATDVNLTSGADYHFTIFNGGYGVGETQTLTIGIDTTAGYVDGAMYVYNDSTGYGAGANDIAFTLVTDSGAIGNAFTSADPSNIMIELLDSFNALGGNLTYTDTSIATTGTSVSYTFKFNTYLEAIKKCVELAPANWYWYVDPATGDVYFQPKGSNADHTMVLGKHIKDLNLEYSLEDMKNIVYYSGGDTGGGVNLLTNNSNDASVTRYGNWLATPSDNRVTLEATADTLSLAILNEFAYPKFKAQIEVPSEVYDTQSFRVGEIVGFGNTNSLIDSLRLQIMSKHYTPDSTQLKLEVLPPTQSKRIEDIRRNLGKQQTENNPNT